MSGAIDGPAKGPTVKAAMTLPLAAGVTMSDITAL